MVIRGVQKGINYEIGRSISRDKLAGVWNAVLIDDQWRIVDIACALQNEQEKHLSSWTLIDGEGIEQGSDSSGETHTVSEETEESSENKPEPVQTTVEFRQKTRSSASAFFFLTDPEEFIYSHMAMDEKWQLLQKPISLKEFEKMPFLKPFFFEVGLVMTKNSHTCTVNVNNGEAALNLGFSNKASWDLECVYKLYKRRDKSGKAGTISNRCVFYQKTFDELKYNIRFPAVGRYKLELYSMNTHANKLELVCVHIFHCKEVSKTFEPLPDAPVIGWGPGKEMKDIGIEALTDKEPIVEVVDGYARLRFSLQEKQILDYGLLHTELEEVDIRKHVLLKEGKPNEIAFTVHLPECGEYALKIYIKKRDELVNICNYLLVYKDPNGKAKPRRKSTPKRKEKSKQDQGTANPEVRLPSAVRNLISQYHKSRMSLHGDPITNYMDDVKKEEPVDSVATLKTTSPTPIEYLQTKDEFLEIKMPTPDEGSRLVSRLKYADNMPTTLKPIIRDEECVFNVNMAEQGEYKLTVYQTLNSSVKRTLVQVYHITRS